MQDQFEHRYEDGAGEEPRHRRDDATDEERADEFARAHDEDAPETEAEGADQSVEGVEPVQAAAAPRDDEQEADAAIDEKPARKGRRERSRRGRGKSDRVGDDRPAAPAGAPPFTQMLINYVSGEECRVAIVEDGKLEELHVERFASASRVGNIYVGKVMNVEPAIQAAFVDFGIGENGFLHVTDLHPRYFPGQDDDATERVGLKTPRRERPPIQHALRRGDEIIVQVLKEGVGTKGPTLTSYLSIPGRFLVMMPHMDKVGVSRKVEDEEERRKMREILDQLELPDGFGFILRTAGMSRTKAELKRDLAYLQRLWKDMDKRLRAGGKPRLLYSESDLLVRALRDLLTNETSEIVIDNEAALKRAARFLKIVAPRSHTRLLAYPHKAPVFHAFGIEKQISLIHAREVPLPSGGRLVIDQTEALVAIDVNSGRSRESRNSEDNAYQTNVEAVDEICRQLRLRDMGGIVICDLIDMRHASRRKDIENRFKERLRRDRAKTTVLPISEFGILEMTRQRMRPSHESVHFTDCPVCRGRGLIQKPDSVAADALRELAAILDVDRVRRVEMVVAPRIAGDLLSSKRQLLSRTERTYGKHVEVRVSESVPVDRVTFYAYDDAGDIDVAALPQPRRPKDLAVFDTSLLAPEPSDVELDPAAEEKPADDEPIDEPQELSVHPIEIDVDEPETAGAPPQTGDDRDGEGGRRKRRRRRGRGRGRAEGAPQEGPREQQPERREERRRDDRQGPRGDRRDDRRGDRRDGGRPRPVRDDTNEWGEAPTREVPADDEVAPAAQPRVLRPEPEAVDDDRPAPAEAAPAAEGDQQGPDEGGRKRRRRRRRRRGRGGAGGPPVDGAPQGAQPTAAAGDGGAPEPDDADDEGDGGEPMNDAAPAPDAGAPAEPGEAGEGGKRRRRRRRRGRGKGAPAQEGQAPPQPAREPARPRAEQPPRPARAEPAARSPEPRPALPPAPGLKPPPRSLYSNVRRKLTPAELNKRPKPE